MFIGHYGVALVAKRFAPRVPLGVSFLAVQLLDVVFCVLVLAGVEKLRIVPGFTEYNPYELYFMPYSHSLAASLVWSGLAGLIAVRFLGRAGGVAVGLAVFSHFLLDLPMHTPDLPLAGNDSLKLGFGLWQHRNLALGVELTALGLGLLLSWRSLAPPGKRLGLGLFAGILVALTLATPFLPPPQDGAAFAVQALVSYLALAGVAAWLVDARSSRTSEVPPDRGPQ